MHHCATVNRRIGRGALVLCVMALLVASAPGRVEAQSVPPNLQPPAESVRFFQAHAVGTQSYMCLPSGAGFAWTGVGPQATLFNRLGQQVITHFLSPNPSEDGTPRATWQSSLDTSAIWASAIATSSDPAFVDPGAIPWLLLRVVGAQAGPTGGQSLTRTSFIQRVNTTGGPAPSTGCAVASDIGKRTFVPYEAIYVFYTERPGR